ncbi:MULTISPECIES: DUF3301 domain-containing protein [Rheinheimera]|uniref:DUF3301 domain-containing protein n=1 Tax=Rheinheimera marina TaxID=1774958 RepID=A0ABV9JRG5_9GAMM
MDFVWLLLAVMAFAYAFLLQRKQDEVAEKLARQLCKQQQLQFLECARDGHQFARLDHRFRWFTRYKVDFSSDGESRYQGELRLSGLRYLSFQLPPHRI